MADSAPLRYSVTAQQTPDARPTTRSYRCKFGHEFRVAGVPKDTVIVTYGEGGEQRRSGILCEECLWPWMGGQLPMLREWFGATEMTEATP